MINIDVVIIGAGPIGLFGVFQAGMLDMKCCVFDSLEFPGGQCAFLYPDKFMYDIPGYPSITGQGLIDKLLLQGKNYNAKYYYGEYIIDINKKPDGFIVQGSKGTLVSCKIILISAGCGMFTPNRPLIDNIDHHEKQKHIIYKVKSKDEFSGKELVILGGGNSALDWAIGLSDIANIHLIHRRDKFTAYDSSIEKIYNLVKNNKLKLWLNHKVKDINKDGQRLSLDLHNIIDGVRTNLQCDQILALLGLRPNIGIISNWKLKLEKGKIIVNPISCETNISGIYSVGDICKYEGKLKLILSGFAEVATALHHGYKYVFNGKRLKFQYSTMKGIKS